MYFQFHESRQPAATWAPTVDVCERADEIVVFVEMPGVERSDVQVSWNEGVLTISGIKRQRPSNRGVANYLCVERAYGQFRREITIRIPVNAEGAKAELKNGLMKISIPKRTEPVVTIIPVL